MSLYPIQLFFFLIFCGFSVVFCNEWWLEQSFSFRAALARKSLAFFLCCHQREGKWENLTVYFDIYSFVSFAYLLLVSLLNAESGGTCGLAARPPRRLLGWFWELSGHSGIVSGHSGIVSGGIGTFWDCFGNSLNYFGAGWDGTSERVSVFPWTGHPFVSVRAPVMC